MPKKNALAAVRSTTLVPAALSLAAVAALILAALAAWPLPSLGGEQPPLRGIFADNFTLLEEPVPAPQAEFEDGTGRRLVLGEFRGRVVLLNFWATWCAPCVREMPSLNRVQSLLGEAGLAVIAVSQDRKGAEAVAPFFETMALGDLGIYLDPKGKFAREFAVRGLPTTMLIDRQGRLVGALEGPAEWDDPDAVALIRHYLDQAGPAGGEDPVRTSG